MTIDPDKLDLGSDDIEDSLKDEFIRFKKRVINTFKELDLTFGVSESFENETSLTIEHNLNTKDIATNVIVDGEEVGATVTNVTDNSVTFDLGSEPVTGRAIVFGVGQ